MNYSDNIKKFRKENGYTQKKLAELLDVAPSAVSGWELGRTKPLMDTLQKMATLFKVSTSDIVGDQTEEAQPSEMKSQLELTSRDKKSIDKEIEKMLTGMENGAYAAFDGLAFDELDPEQQEFIKSALTQVLTACKMTSKAKFTPKKYRNEE